VRVTKYLSINSSKLKVRPFLKRAKKTRKERDFIFKKLKIDLKAQSVEAFIEEVKKIAKDSLKGRNDNNTHYFGLDIIQEL